MTSLRSDGKFCMYMSSWQRDHRSHQTFEVWRLSPTGEQKLYFFLLLAYFDYLPGPHPLQIDLVSKPLELLLEIRSLLQDSTASPLFLANGLSLVNTGGTSSLR